MSKLGQLRKSMGYVASASRCGTCASLVPPHVRLTTDSSTVQVPPMCSRGHFVVQLKGCCGAWSARAEPASFKHATPGQDAEQAEAAYQAYRAVADAPR